MQPRRVVPTHVRPPPLPLQPRVLHVAGAHVRGHHIVPEPHCHEDVRGHVLRVGGVRRDLRVGARGGEPERRVDGVVEGVDDVVRGAGVHRVGLEDGLRDGGGLHVDREVAAVVRGAEERERVEGGGVVVAGVLLREAAHGVPVEEVAVLFGAVAVEDLDGLEPVAFALGRDPCEAFGGGGGVLGQDGQRRVAVLLHPDRVVVGLGLAPIRHCEARVDLTRPPEPGRRVLVLEVVEQQETSLEVRLRFGRSRGRKGDRSEVLGVARRGGEREKRSHGDERRDRSRRDPLLLFHPSAFLAVQLGPTRGVPQCSLAHIPAPVETAPCPVRRRWPRGRPARRTGTTACSPATRWRPLPPRLDFGLPNPVPNRSNPLKPERKTTRPPCPTNPWDASPGTNS